MRGFTLLEVMVALAIIAGVLMTVISSFGYHLGIATRDREETVAMVLARARIDDAVLRGEKTGTGTFTPDWPEISWKLATESTQWPGIEQLNLTVSWNREQQRLILTKYREKQ
ncbi:MAG: type II secretion system protein GspI [Geobacter sp.]|nr:type II secretion system protein GspI [Geobacter sp.]